MSSLLAWAALMPPLVVGSPESIAATSSSMIASVVLPASKSGNSSTVPGPALTRVRVLPQAAQAPLGALPIIEMAPRSQMTSFSEPRGVVRQ